MGPPEEPDATFWVTTTVVASTIDLQAHPVTTEPTNSEPPPDPRTLLRWGSSSINICALPPDGPAISFPAACPFKATQRVGETDSKLKNIQEATESSSLVTKSTLGTSQQETPSTEAPEPTVKIHLPVVETANVDVPSHQTSLAVEPPFRPVMAVPGHPAVNRSDIVPTLRPYVSQAMRQGAALSLAYAIIMAVLAFW